MQSRLLFSVVGVFLCSGKVNVWGNPALMFRRGNGWNGWHHRHSLCNGQDLYQSYSKIQSQKRHKKNIIIWKQIADSIMKTLHLVLENMSLFSFMKRNFKTIYIICRKVTIISMKHYSYSAGAPLHEISCFLVVIRSAGFVQNMLVPARKCCWSHA